MEGSPFTIEALLARDFDLDGALATLADARDPSDETAPGENVVR